MILAEGVSKRFDDKPVLRDVGFEAARGELLLLVGGNGSGKTTLLRCLLGITAYSGRIRVDGFDPLREGRAARRSLGYMPQEPGLQADLKVRETLAFFSDLRRVPRSRGLQLAEEIDLAHQLEARVRELSGGMRQRLHFALALLHDPPILLLDEPTANLDEWSRDLLAERARELADAGKTIVLSTHARRELLEVADRTLVLEHGRLAIAGDGLSLPAAPGPIGIAGGRDPEAP
ncbi:MAG: ABC transporter ATP-binding protein [Thermoanaerobaculia bacterium]|nr:ABC transporter ATP-binding protein [Thermoanaerobaculia bacterium]